MNCRCVFRSLLLALVLTISVGSVSAADFVPLFNGKDTTGWNFFLRPAKGSTVKPEPTNTWKIEKGVLVCTGKPNGYIVTEKSYKNYVLRLQWRFPAQSKGGNSGVLLHCQKEDKVWPVSVEAQLMAGRAGDFWLISPPDVTLEIAAEQKDPKNNRHWFRTPKDEAVEKKFGEWNQYEITCQDGNVTLKVNGKVVNIGKNGNLKEGRIALQSEGAEIHFRNIEIKMLD